MAGSQEPLGALEEEYWNACLADRPLEATILGYREFDDRLPDVTPEGRRRWDMQLESFVSRAEAMRGKPMGREEALNLELLLGAGRRQLEYSLCRLGEWEVDPLQGPQVDFMNAESYQPVRTAAEGRAMVKRWKGMGKFLDDQKSNLERSASSGRVAVRACVEKVIDEVQDLVARPDSEWPLLRPLSVKHADWSDSERDEFTRGLAEAVSASVRPAFERYLESLKSEILPRARPQERPGVMHVPGGPEAYARLIRVHTSLDLSAEQIHQIGLDSVARVNAEMQVLGDKVLGTRDKKEILRKLRTDRSFYFDDSDEVEAKAESSLAKAKAAIPRWFGRLPKTDCKVVVMGEHEAKHSTIAYYRQPAADGSRPGSYYINTTSPETRPRYEAEALAYHESIPGHHLQIAIAQELQGMPDFRRHNSVTAFIEGWGLYSERLADEMGLYSSDLDRIGMLSYDSWRACRLVVDTGMHAKGWTRAQAIDFMMKNTALAENNIVNEVDRYITWPGQALAYKMGQLEILRLRYSARERMGKKFDVMRFHDVLLGSGPVPLGVLGKLVEDMAGGA